MLYTCNKAWQNTFQYPYIIEKGDNHPKIQKQMGYYSRLRDLREDKDLSIRKLAEILHMQRTTYHNYETGKRELPFELAITLAKFYDVSLDYIAGLTNNKKRSEKKQ